jgi:hypothetical protein
MVAPTTGLAGPPGTGVRPVDEPRLPAGAWVLGVGPQPAAKTVRAIVTIGTTKPAAERRGAITRSS